MKKILIGFLTAVVVFVSCAKNNDTQPSCDSTYDPCAVTVPTAEVLAVEDYLHSKGITGAVKHCSGLYYKVDSAGTGKTPGVCSTVFVKYKGYLTDSTVFEDQSAQVIAFLVNQLIKGYKNGILLLKEGGGIHLYIPPSLAYGNQKVGAIPANSILIFQINLVAVQ
jgi:FKBP-type peptidyl-prolyl cis-trans isomerase FkpA